jgi:ABC-type transport system substrate-binding protein
MKRMIVGFAQALPSDRAHVAPGNVYDAVSLLISRQIFDAPFFPLPDGDRPTTPKLLAGHLAADPERPARSFRGRLLPDLRFSDGVPLQPDDFLAAFDAPGLRETLRVQIEGDRVHFESAAPNPELELQLSGRPFVVRVAAGVSARPGEALGTGAYRIAAASSQEFVLARNEYASRAAPIEEVVFRSYPADRDGRPRALLAALDAGQVDLAPRLSGRDMVGIQRAAKLLRPVNSTGSLYFNTERLSSAKLRRAIATAIHRLEIAQASFGENPLAFQATGLLPPALGRQVDGISPSLPIATRLLEESQQRPQRALKLTTFFAARPYLPDPAAMARQVAQQIGRLGLQIEVVQPNGPDEYREMVLAGDYDLLLSGNIADSPDAADFLHDVLSSGSVPDSLERFATGLNFSRHRDAELDAAIATFRADRRPASLQAVTQLLARDVPLFPLVYGRASVAHSWRLQGLQPSITSAWDFSKLDLRG